MSIKLGVIQPGDYLDAVKRLDRGDAEFYFGVRESVDALQRLFENGNHLVISLNAPNDMISAGKGLYRGIPAPAFPQYIPQRIAQEVWAQRIISALHSYRPSHVLLRSGGIIGLRVAQYCVKHNIPTLAVLANAPNCTKARFLAREQKFIRLLNNDCFYRVANFKCAAVQTMLDCGLNPEKATTYEFKGAREPASYPIKARSPNDTINLVFAARMTVEKGAEDVIAAAAIMAARGIQIKLTMIGDGPALPVLRAQAANLPDGAVDFTGWLSNDAMFDHLLNATVAFAPTHHAFPEGLPMALTEALASRTPTLISDHPVFTSAFRNDEGVVVAPQKNPEALANAVMEIVGTPARYQHLSQTTQSAFARVAAPASFSDVLDDWRQAVLERRDG